MDDPRMIIAGVPWARARHHARENTAINRRVLDWQYEQRIVPDGHPHSQLLDVDGLVFCRPEIRNARIFPSKIHNDVPRVVMDAPGAESWPFQVLRWRQAARTDDATAHTYPEAPASPRNPTVY